MVPIIGWQALVGLYGSASRRAFDEGALGAREVGLNSQLYWEHVYASTVPAAQGREVDSVVIYLDTRQQALTGVESWYVSISRAKSEGLVVTDDAKRLPVVIKKRIGKTECLVGAYERPSKGTSSRLGTYCRHRI